VVVLIGWDVAGERGKGDWRAATRRILEGRVGVEVLPFFI
jgi:hypothetical protein